MKTLVKAFIVSFFVLGFASQGLCEDIVGTVVDPGGTPLAGAKLTVKTEGGQEVGAATTNQDGQYQISALSDGLYYLTLNPGVVNLGGQTVVTNVGSQGLTVNWGTLFGQPAVATAQKGNNLLVHPNVITTANSWCMQACLNSGRSQAVCCQYCSFDPSCQKFSSLH